MAASSSLDEQIRALDEWIVTAAEALIPFYDADRGVFRRDLSTARDSCIHPTSTNRSFFALCEYLRFLYEGGREKEPCCDRVREILKGVAAKYLARLPSDPAYVRESTSNGVNMFTDGHLLVAVSLLERLGCDMDLQVEIEAIRAAADRVAEENERRLQEWHGGKIDPTDDVHDFVTLHAVRGIDACRGWAWCLGAEVVAALRERIKDDVSRQLAFNYAGVSSRFDPSELAFSVALLSRFPAQDPPELSERAIQSIVAAQTSDGGWPAAHFVPYQGRGALQVTSYEIALTLVQLLIRRLYEGSERSCETILPALARAFQLVQSNYALVSGTQGWANDHARRVRFMESWVTAVVLTFLIHYRDALLDLRQRHILRQYGTRYPKHPPSFEVWPDLTPAFRRAAWIDPAPLDRISDPTDDGLLAQGIARHVIQPVGRSWVHRPTRSFVILHGAPGSRKTSLVVRIAAALRWPLLIFSPPHFLRKGGLEGFEASAAEIFDDLLRLRRVVVLFDECEDLFKQRERAQYMAGRTIGAFITAGMLPRLQMLHDNRWMVFVLATNSSVAELDRAVTRQGRFDYVQEIGLPTLKAQMRYVERKLSTPAAVQVLRGALERYDRARLERHDEPDISFSLLDQMIEEVRAQPSLDADKALLHIMQWLGRGGATPLIP